MRAIERTLIVALFITLTMAIALLLDAHTVSEVQRDPIAFDEPVNDRPLMTEKEKAWAKESHVCSFWFDGYYWVVEGMPSIYWEI